MSLPSISQMHLAQREQPREKDDLLSPPLPPPASHHPHHPHHYHPTSHYADYHYPHYSSHLSQQQQQPPAIDDPHSFAASPSMTHSHQHQHHHHPHNRPSAPVAATTMTHPHYLPQPAYTQTAYPRESAAVSAHMAYNMPPPQRQLPPHHPLQRMLDEADTILCNINDVALFANSLRSNVAAVPAGDDPTPYLPQSSHLKHVAAKAYSLLQSVLAIQSSLERDVVQGSWSTSTPPPPPPPVPTAGNSVGAMVTAPHSARSFSQPHLPAATGPSQYHESATPLPKEYGLRRTSTGEFLHTALPAEEFVAPLPISGGNSSSAKEKRDMSSFLASQPSSPVPPPAYSSFQSTAYHIALVEKHRSVALHHHPTNTSIRQVSGSPEPLGDLTLPESANKKKRLSVSSATATAAAVRDTTSMPTDNKPSKRLKRSGPPAGGRCHSCNAVETPEWRRGPDGKGTLCNACGLHWAKLRRQKQLEMDKLLNAQKKLETSIEPAGLGIMPAAAVSTPAVSTASSSSSSALPSPHSGLSQSIPPLLSQVTI
ncbi:hypothetical protein RI367_000252 [Sorochytrium milnesiophthora]